MDTPCEPWNGRINENGYGTLGKDLAHRRVWADVNGPIPDGMTLDHLCHDPRECTLGNECPHRRCVNPDHLAIATSQENRERREYLAKAHCPQGHPYSGDNVRVYSGRKHCMSCRRERLRERRAARKLEACLARGHERDERVGEDGRKFCVVCVTASAVAATKARWT